MNLDQAREICHPYGIGVKVSDHYSKLCGAASYIAFVPHETMGYGFAFSIREGISAKELENLALNWCIENSFK
jgi:hypothetical protein